jgi:PAS domain S-box-containing protein
MAEQRHTYQFSEAHFQLALEAARVGMWEWDLLQDQSIWTDTWKAVFGLPPDADMNYASFLMLVHPDDRERVEQSISTSLLDGTAYNTEHRVIWPDGSLHWVAARGRGISDHEGKVIRLIGVAFDITAQKHAEEIQREANKQVHHVLENMMEAFGRVDCKWRITYMNSQAERIGNVPKEQMLGRSVWEVYPVLVGSIVEHTHRQVMETRQPAQCEFYDPHLQQWTDFHLYPAEDGGLAVFIRDITEQKFLEHERDRILAKERDARIEAEAARWRSEELVKQLEREQAFLQAVMEQAPSGLLIAEAPSGKLLLGNEAALTLLGYAVLESEDYTAYTQHGAVHDDGTSYRAEEYPLAHALLSGEAIKQENMHFLRGDGSLIHLSVNAAPILDTQGNIVAAVSVFNDVTERYELERKKDAFICIASHELRTPLTSVMGNLQLAERRLQHLPKGDDDLTSPEGRASMGDIALWVRRALRQVNAENRLINDLLDATYIQTDELHVVLEPNNLRRIVCDTVNDLRAVAGAHALHLELPDQFEIPILADSVRIGQVVTNYVTNAFKYSDKTLPVTVGISLEEREARVWVRDLGPGLSPEAQRTIWDRFSPISGFTEYKSRGGGGLGLGLYLSRALVRQHGGRTGVESAPNEGSTFWFALPLL